MIDWNKPAKSNWSVYICCPCESVCSQFYLQLLAALKQPAPTAAPAPPPAAAAMNPGIPPMGMQGAPGGYYPPAPPQNPGFGAPGGYGGMPPMPPAAPALPPGGNPALANLPPNLMALVQSAQQQRQQQQQRPPVPGQLYGAPPPQLVNSPPVGTLGAPPPGTQNAQNGQYQQLMAYLVSVSSCHKSCRD